MEKKKRPEYLRLVKSGEKEPNVTRVGESFRFPDRVHAKPLAKPDQMGYDGSGDKDEDFESGVPEK